MVNETKKTRARNNFTDLEFFNLQQKQKLVTAGNPTESNIRSLGLILEGTADVINPNDNFCVCHLGQGSHFGAADLIQSVGVEYFGNIYAGPRGLKILLVERPDHAIQLFERKNMQEELRADLKSICFLVENKYRLQNLLSNY